MSSICSDLRCLLLQVFLHVLDPHTYTALVLHRTAALWDSTALLCISFLLGCPWRHNHMCCTVHCPATCAACPACILPT